jgi:hypothetical protein
MAEFVTVAVFTLPHEYAVVKARMESEGIRCFAKDESTVSAHPFYSNVVGGIKLQVPPEDVQHAREILMETGVISEDPQEPVTNTEVWEDVARLFKLPSVPSKALRPVAMFVIALIIITLILVL